MGKLYKFKKLTFGFALITALLFLLIITMLGIGILQDELITTKIAANYQAQTFALEAAEKNLATKEQKLAAGIVNSNEAREISSALCGIKFYQVIASGNYFGTKVTLQSTYAITDSAATCNPKISTALGRRSWRVLK